MFISSHNKLLANHDLTVKRKALENPMLENLATKKTRVATQSSIFQKQNLRTATKNALLERLSHGNATTKSSSPQLENRLLNEDSSSVKTTALCTQSKLLGTTSISERRTIPQQQLSNPILASSMNSKILQLKNSLLTSTSRINLQTKNTLLAPSFTSAQKSSFVKSEGIFPIVEQDKLFSCQVKIDPLRHCDFENVLPPGGDKEVKFPTPEEVQQTFLQEKTSLAVSKADLIECVCTSLIGNPVWFSKHDATRTKICRLCEEIASSDPEFVLKLALYTRTELNIRTTCNFLLAVASLMHRCREYLKKYFEKCIVLPSDWIQVAEFYQSLEDPDGTKKSPSLPAALRKVMVSKFPKFDEYQLAKYNKDKSKMAKKKAKKKEKLEKKSGSGKRIEEKEREKEEEPRKKINVPGYTLKYLIRKLHIVRPAHPVMSILGKKYPGSVEDFFKCGLEGTWDSALAGKRMKLTVPETWETQVSSKGNLAKTWEDLLDHRKLPFMAMLRNLRNMVKAGISEKHHQQVLKTLQNEKAVTRSRQFPFRFFSAYEVLSELDKEIEKQKNYKKFGVRYFLSRELKLHLEREFGIHSPKTDEQKKLDFIKRQVNKKYDKPFAYDNELIKRYKKALDEAVRIATVNNVPPIPGHTVVLCDVRDKTMLTKCTTSKGIGSSRTLAEVGILLGLMCAYSCEACTFVLCAGPKYKIVELEKGGILENLSRILALLKYNLAQGDEFLPQQFLDKILLERMKLDNLMVLSSTLSEDEEEKMNMFLERYRDEISSSAMCFKVNLAGKRASVTNEPGTLSFSGYSDQILKFVALGNADAQLNYINTVDKRHGLAGLEEETDYFESSSPVRPLIPMPAPWKRIRVFISSTIKDMGCERDSLVWKVFPALRERAKQLQLVVTETDLRWGITGEDTRYDRNVSICLREVRKCDIFIGILGERYGWTPRDYGFSEEGSEWLENYPKGRSITELEIVQAAFQENAKNKPCYFYMRDSSEIKRLIPKSLKDQFFEQNSQKRGKLKELKERIINSGHHVSEPYTTKWEGITDGSPKLSGLETFEDMVSEDLWHALVKISRVDEKEKHGAACSSSIVDIHHAYASQQPFVARGPLMSAIARKVAMLKSANGVITALVGKAGSGKTALIANLYRNLVQDSIACVHFAHPSIEYSLKPEFALYRFCCMLAKLCNLGDLDLQKDMESLLGVYSKLLRKLEAVFSTTPQIYFLIDDVGALGDTDWISKVVHDKVTIVVTCLDLSPVHKALKHIPGTTFHPISDLTVLDKREIVREALGRHSKKLDESHFNNQMQALLLKQDSSCPLYLTSVCDLIRVQDTYESLGNTLKNLPHDLRGVLKWQLGKVMARYVEPRGIVSAIFGIIYCSSQWKISEADLCDALCLAFCEENAGKTTLPRALTFGVLNSVRSYLTSTRTENGRVLAIGHSEHLQVLKDVYFMDEGFLRSCHALLADFYTSKLKDASFSAENDLYAVVDALKRLPTHLTRSGQRKVLNALLTDLSFIELKCKIGLGSTLLDDFMLLEEEKGKESRKKRSSDKISQPWQEMREFVRSRIHIISRYPDMVFQEALNQPKHSFTYATASEILSHSSPNEVSKMICVEQAADDSEKSLCLQTYENLFGRDVHACIAACPKGKVFAVGTVSGKVAIVAKETGKIRNVWASHCDQVTALCFVSESILISASADGTMRSVWNSKEGCEINSFKAHTSKVTAIVVRPLRQGTSARIFVSTSHDRSIAIWGVSKCKLITRIQTGVPVNCADFHPHDAVVAAGLWDASIRIWNVQSTKRIAVIRGHAQAISAVQYSSCGKYIASCSKYEKILRLWAASSGIPLGNFAEAYLTSPKSLTFSQDGEYLIGAGQGTNENVAQLAVWNSRLGNQDMRYQVRDGAEYGNAVCCKFNTTETLLAAGFHEGFLSVYDPRLPNAVLTQKIHDSAVNCVSWTPGHKDGGLHWLFRSAIPPEFVITGGADNFLKAVDVRSKSVVAVMEGHTAPVLSVDCCDTWVASGAEDCVVFLWCIDDLDPCVQQQNMFGLQIENNVGDIGQTSTGNIPLTGPKKVKHRHMLLAHNAPVSCIAFNLEGTILVSGGRDGKLAYWNVRDHWQKFDSQSHGIQPMASIDPAHMDWITCCSWSGGNDHVVTGSNDATLKIWKSPTLQLDDGNVDYKTPLFVLRGHSAGVASVVYKMGCIVSTGGEDNSIRVWSHKGAEITSLKAETRTNCCDIALPRAAKDEDSEDGASAGEEQEMDWAEEVEAEEWRQEHEKRKPGTRMKRKVVSSEMQNINVVCAGNKSTVALWKPLAGCQINMMNEQAASISDVHVAGDGKIFSRSTNGRIKLWDIKSSQYVARQSGEVTGVVVFDGGVATACSAGYVYLWELSDDLALTLACKAKIHSKRITAICRGGQNFFATASHDATVNVWLVSITHHGEKELMGVFVHKTIEVDSPAVSLCINEIPSSPLTLWVGMLDGTFKKVETTGSDEPQIQNVLEAPDRRTVVGCTFNSDGGLWKAITNKGEIDSDISLDNAEFIHSYVATEGEAKSILLGSSTGVLYDSDKGTRKKIHQSRVTAIVECGKLLLTASHDCTIKLWSKESLTQVGQFYTGSPVTSACILQDSAVIYGDSSGMVNTLKLHRVAGLQ